jgi:hypothetical protein
MSDVVAGNLTAAQEILFAAAEIDAQTPFSEWDLTVAVWQRNPNRFGCRGYESKYPDHKRVMKEIMSSSNSNPLRKGWIERTGPNRYRLTNVGRSEVQRQSRQSGDIQQSTASPQAIYDAVGPLYRNPVFRKHLKDHEEPRLWLGAASFLQLANGDPQHLNDRLVSTRTSINDALEWLDAHQRDKITRGVTGGSEAIDRDSVLRLKGFLELIEERFAEQILAVRARG